MQVTPNPTRIANGYSAKMKYQEKKLVNKDSIINRKGPAALRPDKKNSEQMNLF
jgi:hypothetical protein